MKRFVVGTVFLLLSAVAAAATLSFASYSGSTYIPASVAAGAAIPVGSLNPVTVSMESNGTATYQIQISLDNSGTPAAASWQNEGTALTAAGSLAITKPCAWLRVNTTAYTSGTPTLRVAGLSRQ
jgi:hypothetical protein